jgi:aspartyl-tRNA(Asn)/glutamyl-tRNA(Gln) amidotransferase subunit A
MGWAGKTAAEILCALEEGSTTAVQVVEDHLTQIRSQDERIGAFLEIDTSGALARAAEIDRKRQRKEPLGPLAGLPVAIKDNLCVLGWKTTCASRMLEKFRAPYDAHVITRLRSADAVLIGRTNLDEFAMGSTCESSAFRTTHNPWNRDCTPGGSSGGSAAAVAAGMAPLAVGSDTGGSIRQPASLCGIVGMKPTYGRVSRYGLVAFASSLDQVGPFAHTVEDTARLLEVLWGHDPRDSTSVDVPAPLLARALHDPAAPLTIGVVPEHLSEGVDPEIAQGIKQAIAVYRELGAKIVDVDLPHARYGVAAYYIIAPSEASSNLARYDGVHYGHRATNPENLIDLYESSRGEAFGDEVKRRIMIGTYALSSGYYDAYYLKAMKVRRLIADDFAKAFSQADVILTPTSPAAAQRLGSRSHDPLRMYLDDVYTVPANLAGIPGLSLPCGFTSSGLPIGMQLLAPAFCEDRLVKTAHLYERESGWAQRRPDGLSLN